MSERYVCVKSYPNSGSYSVCDKVHRYQVRAITHARVLSRTNPGWKAVPVSALKERAA